VEVEPAHGCKLHTQKTACTTATLGYGGSTTFAVVELCAGSTTFGAPEVAISGAGEKTVIHQCIGKVLVLGNACQCSWACNCEQA